MKQIRARGALLLRVSGPWTHCSGAFFMPANVTEWDAHHREAAQNSFAEPASIVSEWLPLLPTGPALDLACGTGRHALLLAARGQLVTAVDWSGTALDILAPYPS